MKTLGIFSVERLYRALYRALCRALYRALHRALYRALYRALTYVKTVSDTPHTVQLLSVTRSQYSEGPATGLNLVIPNFVFRIHVK